VKILIIGFQRSGTTLMRRILQGHPDVRNIYHEKFLLKHYHTKSALMKAVRAKGIDPVNETWGEKTPFYPSIRQIPVLKYCDTWNEYFKNESRILHIIRHPIDIGFSVINKYKKGSLSGPLKMYNTRMSKYIPELNKIKNVFTFKYEDVLINPDIVLPKIFEFCGINHEVDFRKYLQKLENPKYKKLDSSRAFAYKKKDVKIKQDLTEVLRIANTIDGPRYEV